jgi:DNA-binding response OmpR family regulator
MANILLIDDNPGLLKMQVEFLRHAGHGVTTAANGKEGVQLGRSRPFDLLITDIIMPEKDGIEVIVELRRAIPRMKIIAISGGGRIGPSDYLDLAHKLGAATTLTKPFSGKDLVDAVAALLACESPMKTETG